MINRQATILFVLASAVGLGASIFANNWLQSQLSNSSASNADTEITSIVVAAREIPYGKVIEDIHLRKAQWPSDLIPAESIQDTSLVVGKISNQKILEGEPVYSRRVVDRINGSTLSAMIGPNKRAITVRVNDVIGVAGFLLPGNRVDVLATRVVKGRAITKTALENLKVLALDQTANQDGDQPVVVRAVTLEANLAESIELVRATEEGSVQLVLRNPNDEYKPTTHSPTVTKSSGNNRKAVARSSNIEIIRGVSVKKKWVKL